MCCKWREVTWSGRLRADDAKRHQPTRHKISQSPVKRRWCLHLERLRATCQSPVAFTSQIWPGEERRGRARKGEERRGKERKGEERRGEERKGGERRGKERKGEERRGKERKGEERRGREREREKKKKREREKGREKREDKETETQRHRQTDRLFDSCARRRHLSVAAILITNSCMLYDGYRSLPPFQPTY